METSSSDMILGMYKEDRFEEAKLVHRIFLSFTAVYVLFAIADYIYAPAHWVEFFLLRLLYCVVPVAIFLTVGKVKSFLVTEVLAAVHAGVAAAIITYMIYRTSGVASPYYAGLNLVGIITLCFFTFSKSFFWVATAAIYLPYYIIGLWTAKGSEEYLTLVLNSFFILGTIVTAWMIQFFREKYRYSVISSRYQLRQELENRNEIIQIKTDEAVNLSTLSSQFSPQIVDSIRMGKISLESSGQRIPICSIFIDIVNSTERVVRIDKDKVEKVLSKFLDDTVQILLTYDITIDKFLGDGILGFCNAPLPRSDYVTRTLNAALEVRAKIRSEQDFFERFWQRELDIRIGVAKGFANVGFFGSRKYYRTYTAIGPVVNLASRLCSAAEPNQIVIDYDVFEIVQNDFDTNFLGKKSLKGFEQDVIHTYEVTGSKRYTVGKTGLNECPECGSLLVVETNANGQFVFMCRSCCQVFDMDIASKKSAA